VVASFCKGLLAEISVSLVEVMFTHMKKRDNCCLYAVLSAILAIAVIGLVQGYSLKEWNLLSWLGALAIVVAVMVCMKCKQQDEREE